MSESVHRRAEALLRQFVGPDAQLLPQPCNGGSGSASAPLSAADSARAQLAFQGPLHADIKYLSSKLLVLIARVDGEEIAETVRRLVDLSQAYRSTGRAEGFEALQKRVAEVMATPPAPGTHSILSAKVVQVARAFHELLSLSNVCESHHRIRRWRTYLRGEGDLAQKQQPEDVFPLLLAAGMTPEEIRASVQGQICDFVLTAHPTQATRRTLLAKYSRIAELLGVRDRTDLSPGARAHLEDSFDRELLALWRSNTVRRTRPSAIDEARNGLAVVEEVLWNAVPVFSQSVDDSLKRIGAKPLPPSVCTIRMSSWMGGDRDGNPNVTHNTTREVVALHRFRAADLYFHALDELMWELSMNRASGELLALLEKITQLRQAGKAAQAAVLAAATQPKTKKATDLGDIDDVLGLAPSSASTRAAAAASSAVLGVKQSAPVLHGTKRMSRDYWRDTSVPDEPYRLVLAWLREQCFVTKSYWELELEGNSGGAREFLAERHVGLIRHKEQLMRPLELIYSSLVSCGDELIANGALKTLMRRLDCFGLTLVKLDVRQESTRHEEVLQALTQYLGLGDYEAWNEDQRCEFLAKEIANPRPLVRWDSFLSSPGVTDDVKEVVATFAMIGQVGGSESLGAYVISMAKRASHILEVLLLQKEAGAVPPARTLRVAPLFETETDLINAPATMARLWKVAAYRARIADRQEIMLGYSDSAKDAGRITSVWSLYVAQEKLVALAKQHGITLVLFHGRGGSVGRGGGPQHQSILSQPPGSVNNHLRVTIQGETIDQQFGLRKVAQTTFGRYSSATLLATLRPVPDPKPEWRACMERMSSVSSKLYRSYVFELKDFVAYFQASTPVLELADLKLGSRPSRRKSGGGVETLRAIPWIFAFTQTRLHLPVWLGLGAALQDAIDAGQEGLLQAMAKQWPFFNSTLSLIEMVLIKADERIAARYDELLVPDHLKPIGVALRKELARTIALVLRVKQQQGLLQSPEEVVTLRTIQPRLPFVDPLHLFQAELLKLLRREHVGEGGENGLHDQIAEDAFAVVCQGIASGMQNTG